jgi:hypothetical protein
MKKLEKPINKVNSQEQEDPSSITEKGTNFSLRPRVQIANDVGPAYYSICTECPFPGAKGAGTRS